MIRLCRPFVAALAFVAGWAAATPLGTAFTYQGELKVSGTPANGAFDFEFALFNVADSGSAITTYPLGDVAVANGLFTVDLDFTDVPFAAAQEYYLEVRVRNGAEIGAYTPLLPRQRIAPTPYALNARTVQAAGVDQSAIAPGAVGSSQLQSSAVDTGNIKNLAVTGAKLADGTITESKLAFTPGTITAVTAGNGLTGGAGSGSANLDVGAGSGISVTADAIGLDTSFTDSRYRGKTCAAGYSKAGALCIETNDASGYTFSTCATHCVAISAHLCSSAEMRAVLSAGATPPPTTLYLDWIDDQTGDDLALYVNSTNADNPDGESATSTTHYCRCCASLE